MPATRTFTTSKWPLIPVIQAGLSRRKKPAAMSGPPTIGAAGTTSPTLANAFGCNSGKITLLSATWWQDTGNVRAIPVTGSLDGTIGSYTGGANRTANSGAIMFWTDAAKFEYDGVYLNMRILVFNFTTNVWEVAGTSTDGVGSTRYYVPVDFTTGALRLIRIEGDTSMKFFNIRVAATETVWPYRPPSAIKAIALGDSYVGGTGATSPGVFNGCFAQLGYLLDIPDFRCSSSGGTGLVQINGGSVNYLDRYVADIISQGPFDLVIIEGSGNDGGLSAATITANLGTILDAIHTAWPSCIVIVTGSWTVNSNDTTRIAVTAAMDTALAARTWALKLDMSDWMTGASGKVGATAGLGNVDLYVANDAIHPSPAGHDYRAIRMANGIAQLLAAL